MAPLISSDTVQALAFVGALVGGALLLTRLYAPTNAGSSSTKVRNIFLWLAFDALCHMILEASWLYLSTGGRTVRASDSFFAKLWKDYGRADRRWDWADPTVVALELLTVLGDGPIAAYCCYLLVKNDGAYHYWVTVLSVAELYGGWMTFCPEWLTGNKYLIGPSDFLLFYVYLCFMNLVWVFIPLYLMYDSYKAIVAGVKGAYTPARTGPAAAAGQRRSPRKLK